MPDVWVSSDGVTADNQRTVGGRDQSDKCYHGDGGGKGGGGMGGGGGSDLLYSEPTHALLQVPSPVVCTRDLILARRCTQH